MAGVKGTTGLLAGLATFLLGGASGYAARLGLERDPRRGEDAGVTRGFEELRSSLAGLQASVADLKMHLMQETPAPAPTRESKPPEREAIDLADLQELVTRFERATARVSATASGALVIPEGRPQPVPPDVEDDSVIEELRRRFQLMSYQQVLDTLGRPDKVYAVKYGNADAVLWSYIRAHEPSAADFSSAFGIYFRDGLVIDIDP